MEKRISWEEFDRLMSKRADEIHEGADLKHLVGVIVYSQDNFDEPCPVEARSFRVTSEEKVFGWWYIGYSMYGRALDGSAICRLEHSGWKIEYCYIEG